MQNTSTFTRLAKEYLAHRRSLGFALRIEGNQLLKFARYLDRQKYRGPLTLDLAMRWARVPKNASPLYWARRLEIVRPFAKYCAAFDSLTEIPPQGFLGSAHRRTTPYIYTEDQIQGLMTASRELSGNLRPYSYATLIGLLACTGLRISEALGLQQNDVDLSQKVATIRRSKYQKSRLVPLHHSASKSLRHYARIRDENHLSDYFFLSENGRPLSYSTVRQTFRNLVEQVIDPIPGRRPRLHDLRHTFCCRRLIQWSHLSKPLQSRIPNLSIYLGHKRITDTYWYLSGIPELFNIIGDRFEHYVKSH